MSARTDFVPFYALEDTYAAAQVFPFVGTHLLIGPDAELPRFGDLQALGESFRVFCFGMLSGQKCVLKIWPAERGIPAGFLPGDYRSLWGRWPEGRLAALVRARQLAEWALHNRFCGVCGQLMDLDQADIACLCPVCGYKAYPRISPVALGLILRREELLLARAPHFAPGMYSALAGFVETGESAEECLRREVR